MEGEQSQGLCPNCGMSYESHDHQLLCEGQGAGLSTRCGYGED